MENIFNPKIMFLIVLILMFSQKIWDILWDVSKSVLYITVLIYILNYINKDVASYVKKVITDFINIDINNNFVTDVLFQDKDIKQVQPKISPESVPSETKPVMPVSTNVTTTTKPIETFVNPIVDVKHLLNKTNKPTSKNIFY